MSTIERRLAEAYREAAETVRPDSIPGPPGPDPVPGRTRRPGPGRRASRLARTSTPARLARPLAAAVAVAAIAVAATLVVPRIWTGRQATPAGLNAPPRYYAAVVYQSGSVRTVVDIVSTTTGRVTGQLGSPRPGLSFQEVAALGNDGSFVATAAVTAEPGQIVHRNCDTWLYRFRITAGGRPTAPRPLSSSEVPGYPRFNALTGSADGTTVAYTTNLDLCARRPSARHDGQITVLRLPTGRVRSWTYQFPAAPMSLSLSANGQLLGFVSNRSGGGNHLPANYGYAWVLPTGSPTGPLRRYYHLVTGPHAAGATTWPEAVVLSPSGRTMLTAINTHGGKQTIVTLRDYQPGTGRPTRTVRILRAPFDVGLGPGLAPSNSGRYVLIYTWKKGVYRLDLATGRLVSLPKAKIPVPQSAAW